MTDENLVHGEDNFSLFDGELTEKNKLLRQVWQFAYWLFFRPFGGPVFKWWRNCVLRLAGSKVGRHSSVASTVRIWEPWKLEIGDYTALGPHANIYNVDKVSIGSNVTISQETYICTASHDIAMLKKPLVTKPIAIADSAWTCARAMVMPGVKIGEGAVVAMGAVVTKDVEPWTVVGGNPATVIKKRVLNGVKH